jgi:PAS domain S-box-containing protein
VAPDDDHPNRPHFGITELDLGGDIVFVTDADGTIVDVNEAFVRITGYSRREAIGSSPRLLKSGLQDDHFYEQMWATITRGDVWQGQLVDKRRDGRLRTHEVTISPIRDGSGHITNYVAVERDITGDLERQLTPGAVGHVHTDATGRCVYADGRAAALLERTPADLLGPGLLRAVVQEDAEAARETISMAMETARTHHLELRGIDGGWLHVDIAPLTVANGNVIGATWSLEDVTEQVTTHGELSKRDALVASVLDALPEPIAVVDASGMVIATNRAWLRRAAQDPDDAVVRARVGDDLVQAITRVGATRNPSVTELAEDLKRVLTGLGRAPKRTAGIQVTPLAWEDGGAVLRVVD